MEDENPNNVYIFKKRHNRKKHNKKKGHYNTASEKELRLKQRLFIKRRRI